MFSPSVPNKKIEQVKKLLSQGLSHRAIRDKIGVSLGTISLIRNGIEIKSQEDSVKEETNQSETTVETAEDSYIIKHHGNNVRTVDELIEEQGLDMTKWVIKSANAKKREVVVKTGHNETTTIPVYDIKIDLVAIIPSAIEKAFESLESKIDGLGLPMKMFKENTSEKLLEVNLFDLHIDKKNFMEDQGDMYDSIMESVGNLISDITHLYDEFGRIVLPLGNDFFNSDTPWGGTTKGTPQDNTMKRQDSFDMGCDIAISIVNTLLEVFECPIDIVMVHGNHDVTRTYYLGKLLSAYYSDNVNVSVDDSKNPRKYYQRGSSLIGYTHGDEENINNLPLIMTRECRDVRGEISYPVRHLGHLHKGKKYNTLSFDDHVGITVEHLRSLTGTDERHHRKGYVCGIQQCSAFVRDKDRGNCAKINFNK